MWSKDLEFSFCPLRSNNDVFFHIRLVTWTPSTFQKVDKWYSRIWLCMSRRCALRFLNFYFHPWGRKSVEKLHLFSESCWLNFMYNSSNNKQMICQDVTEQSLLMPNKIQEVTFCPRGKKEILKKYHTCISWKSLIFLLLLSPLGRRCDQSFQHIWIPFTQGYSVPSVVEIGQVVLE